MSMLSSLNQHMEAVSQLEIMIPQIEQVGALIINCFNNKGKVFWMGNGGSAADAQHLAAELVGRFERERRALPSIALTTDSSILTSITNDYNFEVVFARQLEALCSAGDIVVGLSTSGNSKNVLAGIKTAKQLGATTIALVGDGTSQLAQLADYCLSIPAGKTARIQEAHILIGHLLCEYIDEHI